MILPDALPEDVDDTEEVAEAVTETEGEEEEETEEDEDWY